MSKQSLPTAKDLIQLNKLRKKFEDSSGLIIAWLEDPEVSEDEEILDLCRKCIDDIYENVAFDKNSATVWVELETWQKKPFIEKMKSLGFSIKIDTKQIKAKLDNGHQFYEIPCVVSWSNS
jgi:hypothetical protein